jgi:adenine/guanine phosphoribosyltransferase-like PRPP-binding protein
MQRAAIKVQHLREEMGFKALACCGSSGMMAAAVLTVALDIPVVYVRKKDENSHGSSVESNSVGIAIPKYLIVDDFICTGSTLDRVVDGIEKFADRNQMLRPECMGVYLYGENTSSSVQKTPEGRRIRIFC